MAKQVILPERVRRRNRRLSGLPRLPRDRTGQPWWRRLLLSPWTWFYLVLTLLYAGCLGYQWQKFFAEREIDGETVGVSLDMLWICTKAALPTLLVWGLVFVLIDRWKPQRLGLWWVALGWGGAVATLVSLILNSWAGRHLNVVGDETGTIAQMRTAVYIAPFVEEATKASVLFLLVALLRHRITNRLSLITLAGLTAIGFAFTENIIYYVRAYDFALKNISTGDPEEALRQMQLLRGVLTSFGHWSFTTLTGIGLAFGMRARSKTVRIMAPLTGYLMACFGHMFFNSQMGQMGGQDPVGFFTYMLVGACVWLLMMAVGAWFAERALIRARLTDYVRMGWLRPRDPQVFGSWRRRWLIIWLALFESWGGFRSSIMLIREMTELAYLRDAMTRGLVDATGLDREKELLLSIRARRGIAVDDPLGRRHRKVWGRWRKHREVAPPPAAGSRAISTN